MRVRVRLRHWLAAPHPWIVAVYACHVAMLAWMGWLWMGVVGSLTHTKRAVLLDVGLLGTFGIAATAWTFLAVRRRVATWTGSGLLLAGFGLLCRIFANFVVYGAGSLSVVEGRSWLETSPNPLLHRHLDAHLYGGPAAFAIGVALTAWASAADLRRAYRG